MKSIIQSIVATGESWEWNEKRFFDFHITMDDGAQGVASSTNQDAPSYKVGDEVTYTVNENQHGTKLKIKKAGFVRSEDKEWAIATAVSAFGAMQMPKESYLANVKDLALGLLNLKESL